jgi:hypothetical protein
MLGPQISHYIFHTNICYVPLKLVPTAFTRPQVFNLPLAENTSKHILDVLYFSPNCTTNCRSFQDLRVS